jgi:hypothetical protein
MGAASGVQTSRVEFRAQFRQSQLSILCTAKVNSARMPNHAAKYTGLGIGRFSVWRTIAYAFFNA